jgi:hypothetical protein
MISPVINKFFSIFWSDESCRSIFLQHKEHLLRKEKIIADQSGEDNFYYSRRFVISNSLSRKDISLKLTQRIKNQALDLNDSLEKVKSKNTNLEEINAYLRQQFPDPYNKIFSKIGGSKYQQGKFLIELLTSLLSEKQLLRFLQNYSLVPTHLNDLPQAIKYLEDFLIKEFSKLLTGERVTEILQTLEQLSKYYQNIYVRDLMSENEFYADVLYDKENFKSRLVLFDMLYEANALASSKYKAYYECTACNPGVFSASATVNVTPSKVRLKCPACEKETFFAVPYEIDGSLFELIKSKDGLLFYAVKYLLDSRGYSCFENVHVPKDVEIDIVVRNKNGLVTDVFEIKMFKTDRPDDTTLSNLREALSKFETTRKKLTAIDKQYLSANFNLVTNLDHEELGTDLDTLKSTDFKKINVYSPNSLVKTFR